jgi:hypothetical protein
MIKPTVGRVVWFYSSSLDSQLGRYPNNEPMAALVTKVWSDSCVNLSIFDPNGNAHGRTSVYLWQGEAHGPRPDGSFCEWMPYQKGQAAKTEQLEKKIEQAQAQ